MKTTLKDAKVGNRVIIVDFVNGEPYQREIEATVLLECDPWIPPTPGEWDALLAWKETEMTPRTAMRVDQFLNDKTREVLIKNGFAKALWITRDYECKIIG